MIVGDEKSPTFFIFFKNFFHFLYPFCLFYYEDKNKYDF